MKPTIFVQHRSDALGPRYEVIERITGLLLATFWSHPDIYHAKHDAENFANMLMQRAR